MYRGPTISIGLTLYFFTASFRAVQLSNNNKKCKIQLRSVSDENCHVVLGPLVYSFNISSQKQFLLSIFATKLINARASVLTGIIPTIITNIAMQSRSFPE